MNSSEYGSAQINSSVNLNHLHAPNLALKDLRILIVEDCTENQFLFTRLLKRRGAEVAVASDGREGVQMALNNEFDIVMMDIQMPVMDGHMAMDELKKANYKVPVIAVTASSHVDEKLKIAKGGFAGQAAKPLDTDQLLAIIKKSISKDKIHE